MKGKVLVVDDEADLELLIKQKFRRQIREQEYEFLFARSGTQALEQLRQDSEIDVVLSDINMPGMDGLTLLGKLSEMYPIIKTIVISAYGDMDNIRAAMNRGAYDFLCKPISFSDLEVTLKKAIQHVIQLRDTLQAIRENNILRMYVDENVLKVMARPESETSLLVNETIEATVAFMDICEFSSISEKEPPDIVVGLINKYFDVMVNEVIAQGGYIDKFIGDAIMAVFRGDYHLDRAIEAALAVRARINSQQEKLSDQATYLPKVSIGINTGEMVLGNIGSAALKRLDYTVIGDVVNVAQRLQASASAGQIVINEHTYESIRESFQCERIGEVKLKNIEHPVMVFHVVE